MRSLRTTWKSTPGNFDPNHLSNPMWSDNCLGIPEVSSIEAPSQFDWSLTFDVYRNKIRRGSDLNGSGLVTFFTEDYRFEPLWVSPERYLTYLQPDHWTLTPDFSLYTDHPPAVHLWNTFRSRWLGAYWQREGRKVIPTVSWAGEGSYSYCFLGLPRASTLAVSTVGVLRLEDTRRLWISGFNAMVERLLPSSVVCCGALPLGFESPVPIVMIEPFQSKFSTLRGL